MMRYLVFSDLHGDTAAFELLLERVTAEGVDRLICTGDVGLDHLGQYREQLNNLAITFVRGNCDSPWVFAEKGFHIPPRYTTLALGQRVLFITHGDIIPTWQYVPIALTFQDIFISGHTHIASLNHPKNSPISLNPGSVSSPRDHQPSSYGVITDKNIYIKSLNSGKILHKLHL